MSLVTCPYTILSALKQADQFLGPNRRWRPETHLQENFLEHLYPYALKDLETLTITELEAMASRDADEINRFLTERGFDLRVDPFNPDQFGTASVFKLLLEWLISGQVNQVTYEHRVYPAVLMEKSRVRAYQGPAFNHPLVVVPTKTGDKVYLIVIDQPPKDEVDMIKSAMTVSFVAINHHYSVDVDTLFPMVDLDVQGPIDWLPGLWTTDKMGNKSYVDQALRQSKVRMNEKGVRVEEAVALRVRTLSASQTPFVTIDKPFLMWVERPELHLPLFVGYITPEDWKEPSSL